MTETIPIRVQHKRMTASDWTNSSLILLDGELGVESDTGKVKVGNGHDRFSALQYTKQDQKATRVNVAKRDQKVRTELCDSRSLQVNKENR